MSSDKPIRRIAIVGTGVIGASRAALFLAHGLEAIATDPAPTAEENLREYIDNAWPAPEQLGLSSSTSKERFSFTSKLGHALEGVDLVQENGPESLTSRRANRSHPFGHGTQPVRSDRSTATHVRLMSPWRMRSMN